VSEFNPEIMLGPPGTGKTTTLLNILDEELTAKTPPDRIGYVSFTQRAAEEARTRAMKRFGLSKEALPHFRTIHSMCMRTLGMRSSDILTGQRLNEFAEWIGIEVTGRAWSDDGLMTGFAVGDRIMFMENLARIRCVDLRSMYNEDDDEIPWSELDRVTRGLNKYKKEQGLYDFTDMLTNFVKSDVRVPLDVLLIDEAQDLSYLQWRVAFNLARGCRRVVVAGDDDQAIYRWAGADVETFINMQGRVRVLGQSWRCPKQIQDASADVINPVKHRREKEWAARKGRGSITRVNEFDECDVSNKWRDGSPTAPVLILARNNYVLRDQVEPLLRDQGMVYEINGRSSLSMNALRAAEAWEAVRSGKKIRLEDARLMYSMITAKNNIRHGCAKLPALGADEDAMISIRDLLSEAGGLLVDTDKIWHDALDRLPKDEMAYMLAARKRGEKLRKSPRIRLSTIHSAKGAEADHVVLMTEMAWRTYRDAYKNPDDERRVWYVGITRARSKLTVVSSQTKNECQWI
jgi:DNA helicase-2/ATP-dependent DNA helicase PcrA